MYKIKEKESEGKGGERERGGMKSGAREGVIDRCTGYCYRGYHDQRISRRGGVDRNIEPK